MKKAQVKQSNFFEVKSKFELKHCSICHDTHPEGTWVTKYKGEWCATKCLFRILSPSERDKLKGDSLARKFDSLPPKKHVLSPVEHSAREIVNNSIAELERKYS